MTTGDSTHATEYRPVYVERVNAVIDYIEGHLSEELTLEGLADVAHFSPYHFHRIFSTMVGETVSRFIARLRLERSATLLIQQPDRPVTDIATACGFANPSSFSRAFREAFGTTPSEWRDSGYRRWDKQLGAELEHRLTGLRPAQGFGIAAVDIDPATGVASWLVRAGPLEPVTVRVEHVPDLHVAYVRHTGKYQGMGEVFTGLFTRLMTWAQPRGLVNSESLVLAVYHDNPSITYEDHLRVSACLSIPEGTHTAGEVGTMTIAGGTNAIASFELGEQDYSDAWYTVSAAWLPDSGYEPDDRHPYERFHVDRRARTQDKQVVDIHLPVRPLRRY